MNKQDIQKTSLQETDILDELSPSQRQRLAESIQQIEEGKTISHEEVMQMAKNWLQRKEAKSE